MIAELLAILIAINLVWDKGIKEGVIIESDFKISLEIISTTTHLY